MYAVCRDKSSTMTYVLPVMYQPPYVKAFFFACHTTLYDLKRDISLKKKKVMNIKNGFTRNYDSFLIEWVI